VPPSKQTGRSRLRRRLTWVDAVLIAALVYFTVQVIRDGEWSDVVAIAVIAVAAFALTRRETRHRDSS
jgi:hypothetical protein